MWNSKLGMEWNGERSFLSCGLRLEGGSLANCAADTMCRMSDSTVTSVGGVNKDKLCLVCGDKALGYNFNAISCESCKAFFRRNAHKGKCDVNVESRSFCKRCRLAKCFTVGMRRDMILNDEQKKVRKQKIIYNKLRRQGQMPPQDTYSASPRDLLSTPVATSTCASSTSHKSGAKVKQERPSSPHASSCSGHAENTAVTHPCWADSQELVASAIDQLLPDQQSLVRELQFAMEETSFLAQTSTSMKSLPSTPTEFVNMAEGFVRKVIKVAKHIATFKTLPKDDQIALLKGSVVDIMMLRSAVNYDPYTESWNLISSPSASSTSPRTNVGSPGFRGMIPGNAGSPGISAGSPGFPGLSAGSPGISLGSPGVSLGSPGVSLGSPGVSLGSPGLNGGSPGLSSGSPGISAGSPGMSAASPTLASAFPAGPHGSEGGDPSRISAELLKKGSPETLMLFMTYSKFIKSLMKSIHGDLLILKILIMMSLFSADRSELEGHERVQKAYAGLRFPEDRTLFARLVMKLTDLRNINEVHSKMLLKLKIDDMEPLLLEVFDLPS
ncbi:hypothetical protein BaRGS_00008962 [Batillaria attramentaria]|uniref:Uncharacterized protein n=1 Tax=Batillaria attramentaria TaxID=370345 RepID=A0ABD0LK29_9CAEN